MQFIVPLRQTAAALTEARRRLDENAHDPAAAHCACLFGELCESRWFAEKGFRYTVYKTKIVWRYRIEPVNAQIISDLRNAARHTIASSVSAALHHLDDDEQQLIAILREANRRMTTNELLSAFSRKGLLQSEGTIKAKLARLTKIKLKLTNRADVTPRGYGLPEWD